LIEMIHFVRSLVPDKFPMHALGIGHPANVLSCYRIGYDLFDSALPTRDARHGRLYSFANPLVSDSESLKDPGWNIFNEEWFHYTYINDKKHIRSRQPISIGCDCLCCSNYSLGYLHHLFKINDGLFQRLATLHNLRFMTILTEYLHSCAIKEAGIATV